MSGDNIYLEFTFTSVCVYITDWTHHMDFIRLQVEQSPVNGQYPSFNRDRWKRDLERYQREFTTITGKNTTYHIKAYGKNYEQIKALAIRYHVARTDGIINKYRLD